MAIDPVCGQAAPEEDNPQITEYAEERYYFCSSGCLQRFEAEPDLFTIDPGEAVRANRDRGLRPVPRQAVGSHAKLEQGHCH